MMAAKAMEPKIQKGALRPNTGPDAAIRTAAKTIPAWLKAWFRPCWRGNLRLPTMPSVSRVSAGSSSAPPAPVRNWEASTQTIVGAGTMSSVPPRMAPQARPSRRRG